MIRDTIESNWKKSGGKAKDKWGKLTNDRLDVIAAKREQLEREIQQAYDLIIENAAGKQIHLWAVERGL